MPVIVTRHAELRARKRYPEMTRDEMLALAEMARTNGLVWPGNNECRRYRYLGKEYVFDERGDEPKLVTVI